MNLCEVVKHFVNDVRLNVATVRAYAYRLFLALSILKKYNITHTDIKPDSILVILVPPCSSLFTLNLLGERQQE